MGVRSAGAARTTPLQEVLLCRTSASVWLPWTFGLVLLLSIAGGVITFGGRVGGGTAMPPAVLESQQSEATRTAQRVRRVLDAGLRDLDQLATTLALASSMPAFTDQIGRFAQRYKRYRSVYVLDPNRAVLAQAGYPPHPAAAPRSVERAGMSNAVELDRMPVVVQYAPVRLPGGRGAILVGEYAPAFLRHSLQAVRPATAWVVNAKGEVVSSSVGFTAFQKLTSAGLRRAAEAARTQSGVTVTKNGQGAQEIIATAPVGGPGQTAALSWGVVTARAVSTVPLPQTRARNQAVMLGMTLLITTVGVFGWLYVLWLLPLRRLLKDTLRIASGDTGHRVQIRRYDEIGLIGCAVERIRANSERGRV